MSAPFGNPGRNPFDDPLDRILAEIAFSVQLPPSLHGKATQRYLAVCKYLDSKPAFSGQIECFYAQGSMAIDATISSRGSDSEYDIDVVAQLGGRFRSMAPLDILKALEEALKDYPVSKVVRQTRCVTLYYADGMHLDVTPAIREYGTPDRQGSITHAKGPAAAFDDKMVPMNAYGFCAWYTSRTPEETALRKAFQDRWLELGAGLAKADADIDEVPDQCHFGVKNTATLALQLIKRFRNIVYADYSGRMPPSVMLAYFAGLAALPNMSLTDMVLRISRWIVGDIEAASLKGAKLHVANPEYSKDVFTDRWPESVAQQNEFAQHLRLLIQGLEAAQRGEVFADRLMEWLRERFGARVVTKAADRMALEVGATVQAAGHSYGRRGSIIVPAVASPVIVRPSSVSATPHTFYGKKTW